MPELKIAQPDIRVEASADGSELTLLIYDIIGEDFWGDGVSAKAIVNELQAYPNAESIRVRINSAGGDVFDASAINTALTEHAAHVTVEIEGMALSAASFIAMAGDTIRMSENAFFMIHEPWTWTVGDAGQLRKDADLLDKIAGQLVNAYAARSGQTAEQVTEWLAAETWFTAAEAQEAGFVNEIIPAKQQVAACGNPSKFRNAPSGIAARFITRAAAFAVVEKTHQEKDMPSDETTPTPDESQISDDVVTDETGVDETPEESATRETPDEPVVNDRAAEGKQFVDAFGEDRGSKYFAQGLSMEESQAAFAKDLQAENEQLRQQIAASSRGEDEPIKFQPEQPGSDVRAKYAKALDGKAERGVASLAARFAADNS